jgi:hypothetical protein
MDSTGKICASNVKDLTFLSFQYQTQNSDQVDQVEGAPLRMYQRPRHRQQHQHPHQRMRQQAQELFHTGFTSMSIRR